MIDATPLWDEDGKVYLIHAYAGSRSGVNLSLIHISGGVVLVTTKQAKEGKAKVEYSGSYTYKMVGLQPELMSLGEWSNACLLYTSRCV